MSSPSDDPVASSAVPAWFADAHAALPKPERKDPGEDAPWSMPIILHIPKTDRPDRTDLLEAAASAVVACCLDERAAAPSSLGDASEVGDDGAGGADSKTTHAPGPRSGYSSALRAWYGARIRKIARRARNAQWDRVQALPGVTWTVGNASARALVPGPVGEEDAVVAKLQIGGTDLPRSALPARDVVSVPTMWMDADLGMSVGKAAAQVGHGSMLLAAEIGVEAAWKWARDGFPLQVREVPRMQLPAGDDVDVVVHDAGFTEIAPGSATVAVTGGRYAVAGD